MERIIWCFLFFGLSYACQPPAPYTGTEQASNSPNVILIVTDDQGYGDLGHHGNPIIKTPHLDRFARESLQLTNFHVGTTCTPTRAGLMTGRNANRNNCWHTIAGCSILLEREQTVAEVFSENGYRTAMIGKWHLGDNYPYRPHDRGFDTAIYHKGGGVGQTPDYWNNDYFDDTYFVNGNPQAFKGYCTDVWFDQAIKLIDDQPDQPFFLYLALNAAHGPFNVPPDYLKIYEQAALTERQKRFYGMISNIDHNFGKLRAHLAANDLERNTILIFTTDNGTAAGIEQTDAGTLGFNGGLRGIKGSHYDGGHRVPFFMRWPDGEIEPYKNPKLYSHVDLLPTLSALAGIDYRSTNILDGMNVAASLMDTSQYQNRMLVVDTQRNQWPEKHRNSCVMSGDWRLIDGTELYNLSTDIAQTTDVANQYPERVTQMQDFYHDWWTSIQSDFQYAQIPIGSNSEEVLITIHDLHTTDGLPWHQNMIREAKFRSEGYYSVQVVSEGNYQLTLSRYPFEAEKSLNATIPEVSALDYQNGMPAGEGLEIIAAVFELDGRSYRMEADPNSLFVTWQGALDPGEYQMSSYFLTETGEKIPVNYHLFKKI